jgi:hypothetical protein
MKVIKGNFKEKSEKVGVPEVFNSITSVENLSDYNEAFCIMKSDDYIVVSTNMEAADLNFLFDQMKMTLLTSGEYEI